jgi:hypothetical protein
VLETRAFEATLDGRVDEGLTMLDAAIEAFEHAGDPRNALATRLNRPFFCVGLGDFERADRESLEILGAARGRGLGRIVAGAMSFRFFLFTVLRRDLPRARALLDAIPAGRLPPQTRALLEMFGDEPEAGERLVRQLIDQSSPGPSWAIVLASLLAERGRWNEVLELTERPLAPRTLTDTAGGEAMRDLLRVRALEALGRDEEARTCLAEAWASLRARGEKIRDPAIRALYLRREPDHSGLLALARERLGVEEP